MQKALLAVSLTESDEIAIFELSDPERKLCSIALSVKQPYGLAFDDASARLFATCWGARKVLAIGLNLLRPERQLAAARLPAWATLRPGAGELWISNEGAGVVTVIDTAAWKIAGEIAAGHGPSDIAFTHNGQYAWVTNEKDATLSLIDTDERRKVEDILVGQVPQGIAVSNNGTQLLVANFGSNSVSVVDVNAKQEIIRIPVGEGPQDVVTVGNAEIEQAWVSCFAGGTVSVISMNHRRQVQAIPVGGRPQGLETHPNGERVYVAVRELNEIVVLTPSAPLQIVRRIPLPGGPARMAVTAMTGAYKDFRLRSDGAFARRSRLTDGGS